MLIVVPRQIVVCLLVTLARAQIRVLSPESLAEKFQKQKGSILGSTATFGAPYYGQRVVGRLMYGESLHGRDHCTDDDYELQTPRGDVEIQGQELVDIIVVRSGKCSFVTKVRVAEEKHAHAVIVVDSKDSKKTPEEIQEEIVPDDGYGSAVHIPSVLISSGEGQRLLESMRHGIVIVELAWDIPRAQVVLVDFWMSSGSRESMDFLERFKESAETLNYHLHFVPHYHVFSLPPGSTYGDLCSGTLAKHCAPDPDGPGSITGADVLEEDVRQLCLWRTTAKIDPEIPESAAYSQVFWEYVFALSAACPMRATDTNKQFGKTCSFKLMTALQIPVKKIQDCVLSNGVKYLDDQVQNKAWSPQALRINEWRYSGPLDQQTVLKAICSGYSQPLRECDVLLGGFWARLSFKARSHVFLGDSLTTETFTWMCVILAGLTIVIMYLYRRYLKKVLNRLLREEVMIEVKSQMEDYAKLEDGGRRSASARLSF